MKKAAETPKYFCVYLDNIKQVGTLTDEESGALFKALFCYANGLDCPGISEYPRAQLALSFMSAQMDRDFEKFRIKSENGKKGGAPKGNRNAAKRSKQPKSTKNNKYNNKDKDKDKDNNKDNNKNKNNDDVYMRPAGAQSYDIDELSKFQPFVSERKNDTDSDG